MRILLSNDDGYFAPGLQALAECLADLAQITVVAPEADRSGASNSLTLDRPLLLRKAANGFFYVNGTPTDCVHLAVTGMLEELPDMVISGINHGANMGDDTIYSGTVAAATEGYLLGIPSIAVSLASKSDAHFETAAGLARRDGAALSARSASASRCCSTSMCRTSRRELVQGHRRSPGWASATRPSRVVKTTNPRNETVYWVGAAGAAQDAGAGTDFHAVANALRVGHAAADRPYAQRAARAAVRAGSKR